jgi:hypothetical protein
MCIICTEFQLQKLTKNEARSALMEMISTNTIETLHIFEVADLIEGEEDGQTSEEEGAEGIQTV